MANGPFAKAPRRSLSSAAEIELRSAILKGHYSPGERVHLGDLAQAIGISATPIREAVMKLVAERVLESRPGHIHIPVLSHERYTEICLIRKQLEGLAGEMAASRVTPSQLKQIEVAADRYLAALSNDDDQAAIELNAKFKLMLFGASGMTTLVGMIESLMLQVAPLFRYAMSPSKFVPSSFNAESTANTKKILQGLRKHDGKIVRTAIEAVIDAAMRRTEIFFEREAQAAQAKEPQQPRRGRGRPRLSGMRKLPASRLAAR